MSTKAMVAVRGIRGTFARSGGKRQRRGVLMMALSLTALVGCGSRLPYEKVLAENQATNGQISASSSPSQGVSNANPSGVRSTQTSQSGSALGQPSSTVASGSRTQNLSAGGTTPTGQSGQATTGPTGPTGGAGGTPSGGSELGPATGSSVSIGQIATDSGLVGSFLGDLKTGAEIWTTYINQHGGLGGHRVQLITADDGGDPSTGLSEAQMMVKQDHVLAFFAMGVPLSLPALIPYLQSVHVPVIQGEDAETQFYAYSDLYPIGSSAEAVSAGDIATAVRNGRTKIATVACVEFAIICGDIATAVQGVTPMLGGTVVYSANISLAQPDYTSQCLAAKSAGATEIFLLADPNGQVRFVNDCANQGYHPAFTTINLVFIPLLLQTQNTIGEIAAGPVFPFSAASSATAEFDQATQQATGAPPTASVESAAWIGGLVLRQASLSLPTSNPSAADLTAGLDKIKNDTFGGLTPPLTYVAGQPTQVQPCYYTMEIAKTWLYGTRWP